MADKEIKLTDTNNTTSNGTKFPPIPKPQVLKENFSLVELNNLNETNIQINNSNND